MKGKAKQAQLHQDNTVKGVKKLNEGQTMVCYVCHKEGHKSYECKVNNGGGAKKKEKNKKQTSKLTNYGGMVPGIHKTRHEPHHQRWTSPQDQGVHGAARRAPQDII